MINIIGGGPAGLYTAFLLAKQGKQVNVFEEHSAIGTPVQCTGITTSHLKRFVETKKFLVNKISIARVCSTQNFVDFKLREENLVIDRAAFDHHLEEMAKKAGAKIFTSHRFIGYEKNKVVLKDTKGKKVKKIKTSILIGADGPLSAVSKLLNKRLPSCWTGVQARVRASLNSNVFEAHLGSVAPGFFAWVVPENSSIARVGLATKKNANAYFRRFLKLKKIKRKDIIEYQGGVIPLYNPSWKICNADGTIFLVGDAARQVKATTGGGLIPSLLSATALAHSILNNKNYEKEFKKSIGKDLLLSLKIRNVLNKFTDKDYAYLIELFKNKNLKSVIEKFDREFPSTFIMKLLMQEPRLLRFVKYLI
jgi:geranylgeranyl reductase family protein